MGGGSDRLCRDKVKVGQATDAVGYLLSEIDQALGGLCRSEKVGTLAEREMMERVFRSSSVISLSGLVF